MFRGPRERGQTKIREAQRQGVGAAAAHLDKLNPPGLLGRRRRSLWQRARSMVMLARMAAT